MTSDKQNQANQNNAQHSTGPATAKGLAISSQNARKHGANAKLEDDSEVTLRTIFPNRIGRISADWFSGELHVPRGKVIYEDDNYQSVYEEELILEVTNGLVTKEIIIKNGLKGNIKRSEKILASKIMLPISDPPEVFRPSPEESDDDNGF